MLRTALSIDPSTHFAGLRRGMMFIGCTAGICAVLVAGADARSAKAGPVTLAAKAGQP